MRGSVRAEKKEKNGTGQVWKRIKYYDRDLLNLAHNLYGMEKN